MSSYIYSFCAGDYEYQFEYKYFKDQEKLLVVDEVTVVEEDKCDKDNVIDELVTVVDDSCVKVQGEDEITVESSADLHDEDESFLDKLDQLGPGAPVGDAPQMYEVSVKTGDVVGAGTDSNVYITIFGEKGDTGKVDLEVPKHKSNNTFEKNCEDNFIIEAKEVGRITCLRIGHDNKGSFSGWYLERVVICVPEQKRKVTFEANRWLDKSEGDGKLEIDVKPTEVNECDQVVCEHPLQVDVPTEGTDESKVELVVPTDSPLVADNTPPAPEPCTDDAVKAKPAEVQKVVEVQKVEAETMKYVIEVKTGDVKFAGTDANVFVILYGDRCNTTKLELKKSLTHKNSFGRDHVDRFDFDTFNVGNLQKIRLGHDNKGGLAGWYVDKVTVSAPAVNAKWICPANRWLDKSKGDHKLEVDLVAKKQ